jgi:hypothetical protein
VILPSRSCGLQHHAESLLRRTVKRPRPPGPLLLHEQSGLDGGIGKVDKANNEAAASWLIVDTGPWIFGKKVMLPAGVVARINSESEVVHVNRTKEEIKNAPEFDEGRDQEQGYRDELGGYYGTGGRGYRE